MYSEEIKARIVELINDPNTKGYTPMLFAYVLLSNDTNFEKGCEFLQYLIDQFFQMLDPEESTSSEEEYISIANKVNEFFREYHKEIKQNIRYAESKDSIYNIGRIVVLKHNLKKLNNISPCDIDLDWFTSAITLDDEDIIAGILAKVYDCIFDNEIREDQDDDEDWENTKYQYSMGGVFNKLAGIEPRSDASFVTDTNPFKSATSTLRGVKNFYELWLHIDFGDLISHIQWNANLDLPDFTLPDSFYNNTELSNSVYHTTIAKFKHWLHVLDKIDTLLAKVDDENFKSNKDSEDLNYNRELVAKRVSVLREIISYVIDKTSMEKILIETNIMLAERNRILSSLSHSIKNMLKSVIDPLENLRNELPDKAMIIENAIKGANLIREIVNSINLSYKTTLEELQWDVLHPGRESMTLQDMIRDSLSYSVSNMFDFRYFPTFAENYFPRKLTKLEFYSIKEEWGKVSSGNSIDNLMDFTMKNMFNLEIKLDASKEFHVGNEKSSAIKLMILFQEIIFNAVKYTSFVPFKDRTIAITLDEHEDKLRFTVKNSFSPDVQAKTTGVGKLVIENFAKVLDCQPVITIDDKTFMISMEFTNIWRNNAKNPVH